MDGDGISLAIGGSAVGALCTLGAAWIKARWGQKTTVDPTPLPVKKAEEYVRVEDFQRHVVDNERAHESLESRMNRADRETSEIKGMMRTALEDLSIIKGKLLKDG